MTNIKSLFFGLLFLTVGGTTYGQTNKFDIGVAGAPSLIFLRGNDLATLSPILLGLLRAFAALWGIWLYRCPNVLISFDARLYTFSEITNLKGNKTWEGRQVPH
jgi:hypothetical protein